MSVLSGVVFACPHQDQMMTLHSDSGADISHPALQGKWRGGPNSWIDIINGLPDPYDDIGHGTHVTGTIALMLHMHPALSYGEIWDALCGTAVDLGGPGYDHDFGYGRLDANEAVTVVLESSGVGEPRFSRDPVLVASPNPFRGVVAFSAMATGSLPDLEVFDPSGRRVRRLSGWDQGRMLWDGCDTFGRPLPSGTYLVLTGAQSIGVILIR